MLKLITIPIFIAVFLIVVSCERDHGQPFGSGFSKTANGNIARGNLTSVPRPDRRPLNEGPISPDGIKIVMATSDFGVGRNRIGFVLISAKRGFLKGPIAKVTAKHIDDRIGNNNFVQSNVADYRPWSYGSRGAYITWLDFKAPGLWSLDVTLKTETGTTKQAQATLKVEEIPAAPATGAPAIMSVSKTVADVDTLEELSTGSLLDKDLYRMTIAEAVITGKPTVIVFASPGFCTNAVCGPQVEVLQRLKDTYNNHANFIHVDFYENPHQIQGDLEKAIISSSVLEWRLPSAEWTFVIDRGGIIQARLEGFSTYNEIEGILRDLL